MDKYEFVEHPKHYNTFGKEVINMMVDIWGIEKAIAFCEMSAFKYKMRMGDKPNQPLEQDLSKATWYLNKAKELSGKLDGYGVIEPITEVIYK
jgi:Protein of unknwon function (DUF3310)